jgi:PGF-CTERM protein
MSIGELKLSPSRTALLALLVCSAAAIGLAAGLTSAQSSSATEIDGCTTISEPGRYVLTGDVQYEETGACIEVASDDVVVDGAGNAITGQNETSDQIAIQVSSQSNVTVQDLEASELKSGINYTEVTDGEVRGVTASSNVAAIELIAGSENTITNNTVRDNGNGIFLHAREETTSDRNRIEDNDVINNTLGITFIGAHNNTVVDNTVNDSKLYGLSLLYSGLGNEYNTFRDNVVVDNAEDGVCLLNSRFNTFEDTYVENSGRYDVYAVNNSTGNEMSNLTLTSTSMNATIDDVSLVAIEEPPATAPEGGPAGYVNATDTSADSGASIAVSDPDAEGTDEGSEDSFVYEYAEDDWTRIGESDSEGTVTITDLGEPRTHHLLAFLGEGFAVTDSAAEQADNGTTTEPETGSETSATTGTATDAGGSTDTTTTATDTATATDTTASTTSSETTAADTTAAASTTTTSDAAGTTANDTGGEGGGGQATETTGPGFGLLAALVALLGAALLAARRR